MDKSENKVEVTDYLYVIMLIHEYILYPTDHLYALFKEPGANEFTLKIYLQLPVVGKRTYFQKTFPEGWPNL